MCRTKQPKRELVRIVRTPDGTVTLDLTGRANGRGAYICRTESCRTSNAMKARLKAALNAEVSEEVRKLLFEHIAVGFGSTVPAQTQR